MTAPLSDQERQELARFRLRLNRDGNLPGYYAIPYQYIVDMQNMTGPSGRGVGGYTVLTVDYGAFFAAYEKFGARYRIYRLPFVCDRPSWNGQGRTADTARAKIASFGEYWRMSQDASLDEATRRQASARVMTYLQDEVQTRGVSPLRERNDFSYARIPADSDIRVDRVADFYHGKFNEYYCPSPAGAAGDTRVFPGEYVDDPAFRATLEAFASESRMWNDWFPFFRYLEVSGRSASL